MTDYDDQEDHNFAMSMAAEQDAEDDYRHELAITQNMEDQEREDQ